MPLKLPSVIDSRMVIQCDSPVPIWGWADSLQEVHVRLGDRETRCTADEKGAWSCALPPFAPGRELELTVTTSGERIDKSGILTGEVWLCCGQSNMANEVGLFNQRTEAVADADYPRIRFFTVERATATECCEDCRGEWKICSPRNVLSFSSVGFHFARSLHKKLDIPVGVIVSAVVDTSVKQWVRVDVLRSFPQFGRLVEEARSCIPGPYRDEGISYSAKDWHDPAFDDTGWGAIDLPAPWFASGLNFNGAVWFRREFEVPAAWVGRESVLSLGILNDFDMAFVNDIQVGSTDASTPGWWGVPRRYPVPAGVLRPDRNVVAFRLFNQWDDGGIKEEGDHRMRITCPGDGGEEIPISGPWRFSVEAQFPVRRVTTAQPCGHYHAMIAPLLNLPIRGCAWYQAESDIVFVEDHRVLFPALIRDWRRAWGRGDFPFLFVQLPKYAWPAGQPGHGCLPAMRAAQAQALSLPATGMAVALDLGEAGNVHPQNKRDVGIRLSYLALNRVYDRRTEDEGPRFEGFTIEGDRVRIRFSHNDGLHARGEMEGFEIAGKDGWFRPARAWIEGGTVVAGSESVLQPSAVRYAWGDCPPHPLYNGAGLPAPPFRSDSTQSD